jgi:hypothetical protein
MQYFAFAYCCDGGQGGDNTLPNCTHSKMFGTLFMLLAIKTRAVFARRGNRFGELYVSINDSVYVPCLQIRLAQFDSGSRLHINQGLTITRKSFFVSSVNRQATKFNNVKSRLNRAYQVLYGMHWLIENL